MATTQQVTQLYKELLGRAPDTGGLKHYSGYSDPNAIRSSILSSQEYKSLQANKTAPAQPKADPAAAQRVALEKEVGGLFGELGSFDETTKAPVDVYNQALEGLGLSDARTRVTDSRQQLMNTEALLKSLAGDIEGRTQGYNVNEGQRRRLLAMEQEPLAGQVDVFNQALEGAMGDYGMILGEGKTQAELTFQGDQAKRQGIMDRLQIKIDQSKDVEDKRRWEAELARAKEKDAEIARQFNAEIALKQQEARKSGSSSGSRTDAKTQAQQQVSSYIMGPNVRGRDGYISPVTYKQLKGEWVGAGYSSKDFDDQFKMYANPTHLKDYGL